VTGAPDIFVQDKAFELSLPGFLKLERIQAAEIGTMFIDGTIAASPVQKIATLLFIPFQGHDELLTIGL